MADILHSPELGELGAALALAQAEVVGAKKDSNNPFYKSDYADLASVWDACRKPLTAHGLSVVQMPGGADGSVDVSTLLLHKSGQWICSTCHATPKDTGPQAVGSVITYLRRYALAAVAGIAQIDDDGEGAEGHDKPAPKATPKPKAVPDAGAVPFVTDAPPDWEMSPDPQDGPQDDAPPVGGLTVNHVKVLKQGANAKGPWTMHAIGFSDGSEGVTFDDKMAAVATRYQHERASVIPTLVPSPNGKGHNVTAILRMS